jgi:hypothetical protein
MCACRIRPDRLQSELGAIKSTLTPGYLDKGIINLRS